MSEHEQRLAHAIEQLTCAIEYQAHIIQHQTERIIMKTQDAIDALTSVTAAATALAPKVDTLIADTNALITALGDSDLTQEQQAAVTAAQASAAALTEESIKVDAAVEAANTKLNPPAPTPPPAS